jgi:hypothetical protein
MKISQTNLITWQKYILLPFTVKTSLKVLHIRQTCSDLRYFESMAIDNTPMEVTSDAISIATLESWESEDLSDSGPGSDMEGIHPVPDAEISARRYETPSGHRLKNKFCRFAEWVFGPQGIASLQVVVFGDFAHGGRMPSQNLLLCRSRQGRSKFRVLGGSDPELKRVQAEYRKVLEACPVQPLSE